MSLVWKQLGPANYYALTREGGKYTIDRLSKSWMASFLPTGSAEGGRVRLTPDNRLGSLKRELLSNTSTRTLIESAVTMEAVEHPNEEGRMVRAWIFDELEERGGKITMDEEEAFEKIYDETGSYLKALVSIRPQLQIGNV